MKKNLFLLALVVVLILVPFFLPSNKDAEYGGADGIAEGMITEIHPDYKPWFASFYEPASGEIESLLFTLQGALGSGVICYILGYYHGKKPREEDAGN